MKFIGLLIIPMFVLTFLSCKKDREEDTQKINSVVGEWTWLKSYGGFSGTDLQTPSNTNIAKKVLFMNNGDFVMIENGDTIQNTTYFTSREKSILLQDTYDFVTVNYKHRIMGSDSIITLPMRYMINSMSDSLIIDEDVFDGYGHKYLRIK